MRDLLSKLLLGLGNLFTAALGGSVLFAFSWVALQYSEGMSGEEAFNWSIALLIVPTILWLTGKLD